jgi:hypothetical protein
LVLPGAGAAQPRFSVYCCNHLILVTVMEWFVYSFLNYCSFSQNELPT